MAGKRAQIGEKTQIGVTATSSAISSSAFYDTSNAI
jgi:hypothetical protein